MDEILSRDYEELCRSVMAALEKSHAKSVENPAEPVVLEESEVQDETD